MCESGRPDDDKYGIRVRATKNTDAVLQRANIQQGYTLVIWRGRHVAEPTELTDEEAAEYWLDVLTVSRALIQHYRPLKLNYETLGNSLPHLHTHLVPRYLKDPTPGRPFPLLPVDGSEPLVPDDQLQSDAEALRSLMNWHPEVDQATR
ncbi:HIT family protein [Amycolatopsis sp. NPDC059027]|uniref:HIT family protein n=1 Tax=Amycolatopsis sp. NPDC059027 TaxID=3346709 RepID=UPI00366A5649